jgi:transposase
MTERQLASVDVLKAASTDFCTMRHLAMRLRGLLRGGTVEALKIWLTDARSSNIHGIRRFSRTVRQEMLKRAMYGRAGVDLLRARMFPLVEASLQRE